MTVSKHSCLKMLIIMACSAITTFASADAGPPVVPAAETHQSADSGAVPAWFPKLLGMQFNGIYQNVPAFRSPYRGENSFTTTDGKGHDFTQVYGLYLGSQLLPSLQAYLDLEYFRGNGISDGIGLSGYVNGDVIRAGSSDLSKAPYVARMLLKYTLPLSGSTEKVERSMDQLPGEQAVDRWEFKVGKMGAADDFDQNRYANNNRTQFFNFDFLYNTAWDYAADTRGYSYGVSTSLVHPGWKLALGAYMEPNTRNGATFDFMDMGELGYNLELTLKPNDSGTVVRLLAYLNQGRMGSYAEALALGRATTAAPDLLLVERPGSTKYGFGLNVEQPFADDGETGLFGRIGWNDGSHESWSYVESDVHGSIGLQVSGMHWGRKDDHLGIAYGVNGLSAQHRDYLEAGGSGILLGDGNLKYGYEQAMEAYYSAQLGSYLQVSPDFQFIRNPGFNRDRGPVEVYGVRFRASF